jgi:hypothetical protein
MAGGVRVFRDPIGWIREREEEGRIFMSGGTVSGED